jgi:hypothetical protein
MEFIFTSDSAHQLERARVRSYFFTNIHPRLLHPTRRSVKITQIPCRLAMSSKAQPQTIAFPPFLQLQSVTAYEASQPGLLGPVTHELHAAPWDMGLKGTMQHLTYRPEYDRLNKSAIFKFFVLNARTVTSRNTPNLER